LILFVHHKKSPGLHTLEVCNPGDFCMLNNRLISYFKVIR
jgi:hypothetical protein